MVLPGIVRSRFLVFVPLLLVLMIAVACGDDATPTRQPTQPPPTTEVSAIEDAVSRAVQSAMSGAAPAVTAEEIQGMVQAAVGAITPTGLSAEEIQSLVAMAVSSAVPEGASAQDIQALVTAAVVAAAQPGLSGEAIADLVAMTVKESGLSAEDVEAIVKAAIPATPTPAPTATPVPTPKPSPTPGFMTSSVERLIVLTPPPAHDTNIPWRTSSANFFRQRPMYDFFIHTDAVSVSKVPGLAAKWEASTDAKDWTLDLQRGVQLHKGFGEYTATDAVHSYELYTQEESTASWSSLMMNRLGASSNIEVVNDHKIIMHLVNAEPDLEFQLSDAASSFVGLSKDYWEATGRQGQLSNPIGTGSWQFKDESLGEFVLYERVENHWRKTPEFRELILRFMVEQATRLAMMLTREGHIADLPEDLLQTAIENGMDVTVAAASGTGIVYNPTGLYFATPEKLDPTNPLLDIKVREALNRAWNKQEVIEELYSGRAKPAILSFFAPNLQGWDETWPERWEEMYAYDPEKARQLLADAGYADGFKLKIIDFDFGSGVKQLNSALALYFEDIGIDVELVNIDYAIVRDKLRDQTLSGAELFAWGPSSIQQPHGWTRLAYHSEQNFVTYDHEVIDQLFVELDATTDIAERDLIQRAMGEHLLTQYASLPTVFVPPTLTYDPAVVAEFNIPGTFDAPYSHFEYVVAAR